MKKVIFNEFKVQSIDSLFQDQNTKNLFLLVFEQDAIIAGGFPHFLLKTMYENPTDDIISKIQIYFSCGGDIDIFFKSYTHYLTFLTSFNKLYKNPCVTYSTENAISYDISLYGITVKVQFIIKQFFDLKETLDTFDIYNAMCAIKNNTTIIAPKDIYEFFKRKILHVQNYFENKTEIVSSNYNNNSSIPDEMFLIHRISKWFHRHDYNKLSSLTEEKIIKILIKLSFNNYKSLFDKDLITNRNEKMFKCLSVKNQLFLSCYFNNVFISDIIDQYKENKHI